MPQKEVHVAASASYKLSPGHPKIAAACTPLLSRLANGGTIKIATVENSKAIILPIIHTPTIVIENVS
jgi:hypothetical protein